MNDLFHDFTQNIFSIIGSDFTSLWTDFAKRITDSDAFSLVIVGMGVVFSGLVTLFICLTLMQKIVALIEGDSNFAESMSDDESLGLWPEEPEQDINQLAAVIGLTLHLHKIRHSRKEIKIQRNEDSPWKQVRRSRSMERL